mgnify:CR=1 FL=1
MASQYGVIFDKPPNINIDEFRISNNIQYISDKYIAVISSSYISDEFMEKYNCRLVYSALEMQNHIISLMTMNKTKKRRADVLVEI